MPVSSNNSDLANRLLAEASKIKRSGASNPSQAAPLGPGSRNPNKPVTTSPEPQAAIATPQPPSPAAEAPQKIYEVGRIISVGSSRAIMSVSKAVIRNDQLHLAQLGSVLKIRTRSSIVITMVSSLKVGREDDEGMSDGCLIELDIMGEITKNFATGAAKFYRGVRTFPVLNEAVYTVTTDELRLIFAPHSKSCIDIGALQQNGDIRAQVRTDDLLSKHFAVVGSTGSGKSCTVALLLQEVLRGNNNAHVVLFDPHNEYSASFGNRANVINSESLELPLWLFDFDETLGLLASDVPSQRREETEILSTLVLKAKQSFERNPVGNNGEKLNVKRGKSPSLNSPSPYRINDLLKLIDNALGRLENSSNLAPYLRLKRRIELMLKDTRYNFIFKNGPFPNTLQSILGKIFRLPVNGKPISILDLSGIPSEALNVVVSVICRLAFDLAVWSERKVPILLVCEEAHRYIPNDKNDGFGATRRAIGRIAKEGRKYGVSIGLVSQRPSELDPTALSQCSTIFSMRLTNQRDQDFVQSAIPDSAGNMLSYLPSLGTAETMVFGESVNLPMRIIMKTLPEAYRPHSSSASFTQVWGQSELPPQQLATIFNNWMAGARQDNLVDAPPMTAPPDTGRLPPAASGAAHPQHGQTPAKTPEANRSSYSELRKSLLRKQA